MINKDELVQIVHSPIRKRDLSHKRNTTQLIGPRTPDTSKTPDSRSFATRNMDSHPRSDIYVLSSPQNRKQTQITINEAKKALKIDLGIDPRENLALENQHLKTKNMVLCHKLNDWTDTLQELQNLKRKNG